MAGDRNNIKSAKRALEILDLFERVRRPLRVSDAANLLSYPQSSTSFLMNTLRGLGYLSYDPEGRTFAPTLRVGLLGSWLEFGDLGPSQVFEMITELRNESGEGVIVSTRSGVYIEYIYVLDPPGRVMPVRFRAGSLRPICRLAPGILLLADCTDAEVAKVVRWVNASDANPDREDPEEVLEMVRAARASRVAVVCGRMNKSWGSIAVKLPFNDRFDKPLVLSLAGPKERIMANASTYEALMLGMVDKYSSYPGNGSHSEQGVARGSEL